MELPSSTEQRVKHIQYAANLQIQDKIAIGDLKSINAYTVSIFDGHGGSLLADYCSEKVVGLIDSFIEKNK